MSHSHVIIKSQGYLVPSATLYLNPPRQFYPRGIPSETKFSIFWITEKVIFASFFKDNLYTFIRTNLNKKKKKMHKAIINYPTKITIEKLDYIRQGPTKYSSMVQNTSIRQKYKTNQDNISSYMIVENPEESTKLLLQLNYRIPKWRGRRM